jgi:hypothetical protein
VTVINISRLITPLRYRARFITLIIYVSQQLHALAQLIVLLHPKTHYSIVTQVLLISYLIQGSEDSSFGIAED